MWKGDKSASQLRKKELFGHKHVTSHAGMAIPHLFNPQKRARESTAFLYMSIPHLPCTGTGPTHLWQKMPVICQTKLLFHIEEKELVLLKKYLPATPDNILTLHRSAGLSAKGVLTLVVQCTDDISKANANMQYYAFQEFFFLFLTQTLVNMTFWGITNMKCYLRIQISPSHPS